MNCNVYEPNAHLKLGVRIWAEMFREMANSRELIWRLFKRNLLAKSKQAIFGSLWIVITPFVAIGTFMFLNRVGIMNIEPTGIPYPVFALMGLSVWQIFSTGINSGCSSLVSAGDMIAKVNFPREVLVFSSLAESMFEFAVKCVLIIAALVVFRFVPHWQIVFLPLAIIPIVVLTGGLSLILSLANGIFRDTVNIVNVLITFLMFLTPVLYPISDTNYLLLKINPLSPLVAGPRDLLAYGRIRCPEDFFLASGFSVLVFLVCWRLFHLAETKIPERM